LVGLIPALYSSRRRVWLNVIPVDEGRMRIEVAGIALQRRHAFEDEFAALVRDLGRELNVEQPGSRTGSRVESGIDAG
jgi:cytochrome c biogenesis protein ResB